MDIDREIIEPCDFVMGEELLYNFMNFSEPQNTFDDIIDKICNNEPETLREKQMFLKLFFLGDESSGICNYNSKVIDCWHLNDQDFNLIQKLRKFHKEIWIGIDFKRYEVRKSSYVFKLSVSKKNIALQFAKFYTKDKEKRIPNENGS